MGLIDQWDAVELPDCGWTILGDWANAENGSPYRPHLAENLTESVAKKIVLAVRQHGLIAFYEKPLLRWFNTLEAAERLVAVTRREISETMPVATEIDHRGA